MINEVKMRMRRCDISFDHRQKLAKIMSQMAREKEWEELGTSIYYQDLTRFRDSTRLMKEALNEFDNTIRNLDTLSNDQVFASPTKVAFSYKQQKTRQKAVT